MENALLMILGVLLISIGATGLYITRAPREDEDDSGS